MCASARCLSPPRMKTRRFCAAAGPLEKRTHCGGQPKKTKALLPAVRVFWKDSFRPRSRSRAAPNEAMPPLMALARPRKNRPFRPRPCSRAAPNEAMPPPMALAQPRKTNPFRRQWRSRAAPDKVRPLPMNSFGLTTLAEPIRTKRFRWVRLLFAPAPADAGESLGRSRRGVLILTPVRRAGHFRLPKNADGGPVRIFAAL